jgi:hypothetical protein
MAKRLAVCVALIAVLAAAAGATPQGFSTDLASARAAAAESGKLIYVYFHLNG